MCDFNQNTTVSVRVIRSKTLHLDTTRASRWFSYILGAPTDAENRPNGTKRARSQILEDNDGFPLAVTPPSFLPFVYRERLRRYLTACKTQYVTLPPHICASPVCWFLPSAGCTPIKRTEREKEASPPPVRPQPSRDRQPSAPCDVTTRGRAKCKETDDAMVQFVSLLLWMLGSGA